MRLALCYAFCLSHEVLIVPFEWLATRMHAISDVQPVFRAVAVA